MNLKEESESLQSRLNQVLNLVAEAQTSADRLLNTTSSQIVRFPIFWKIVMKA